VSHGGSCAGLDQWEQEGGQDSTLFLMSLKVTRMVPSLSGHRTHLQEVVWPRGPPPQPNLDPFSPVAPPGDQVISLQLQGLMGTQVRHMAWTRTWGEMDLKFPVATQLLPQKDLAEMYPETRTHSLDEWFSLGVTFPPRAFSNL
jgi:hypothetical protein